jgi:hypothetical protein
MIILADDWHFHTVVGETVVVDLYLDNGQHALLEVNPMRDQAAVNGDIPEIIVFCEMPGEKLDTNPGTGRWIARPPSRSCPWSNVQLPQALWEQIRSRLHGLSIPTHLNEQTAV